MNTHTNYLISSEFRFTTWPEDALLRVAENFIKSMQLSADPVEAPSVEEVKEPVDEVDGDDEQVVETKLTALETNLVDMVMFFNTTIVDASARFFMELSRKNYVTPTSYLEMLRSFKILYTQKYNEITMKRDR